MRGGRATTWDAYKAARAALGTPFHPQGRCPGAGLDCVGLVLAVAAELGVAMPDVEGYDLTQDRVRLLPELEGALLRIELEDGRPGDVIALWVRREGETQHAAILAPGDSLIHACQAAGRVVQVGLSAAWRRRIVAVFRFPGLKE